MADEKRLGRNAGNKEHKYDNNDPINWNTVDLNQLALDVVHYARMGLDMMQDNHLSAIPYKDNNRKAKTGTQLYTVNLMPGYNGIQYIAEKYAIEKPIAVTIELVYSTDTFRPVKKNRDNRIESYEFEINNAFDRGEVVGGFGYIEYEQPERNKLVIMTMKDIEKRKPQYAAAEFWGGKTARWENGKKVEAETDGWREEMYLKTLKREVYSAKHMPRDPKKIDDAYQYMRRQEIRMAQMEVQDEIEANSGRLVIDMPEPPADAKPVQQTIGNIVAGQFAQEPAQEPEPQPVQAAGGPGF
jgi:recombination protein RecT